MQSRRFVISFTIPLALVALFAAVRGNDTSVAAADTQEITVTLGAPDTRSSAEREGDTLRRSLQFGEAIEAYSADLERGGLDEGDVREIRYNIGLCRLWLGEYDKAEAAFESLIADCPDDGNAVGYCRYCLAWMAVQRGEYQAALTTLNETIAGGGVTDTELAARLLFMTGRIRLAFLNDPVSARPIFRRVGAEYPETRIAAHPFVTAQTGK